MLVLQKLANLGECKVINAEIAQSLADAPVAQFSETTLSQDSTEVTFTDDRFRVTVSVTKISGEFLVSALEVEFLCVDRPNLVVDISPAVPTTSQFNIDIDRSRGIGTLNVGTSEKSSEWRPEIILANSVLAAYYDASEVAKGHAHGVIRGWLDSPWADGEFTNLKLVETEKGTFEWVGVMTLKEVPARSVLLNYVYNSLEGIFEPVDHENDSNVPRAPFSFEFRVDAASLDESLKRCDASVSIGQVPSTDAGRSLDATVLSACLSKIANGGGEIAHPVTFSELRKVFAELVTAPSSADTFVAAAQRLNAAFLNLLATSSPVSDLQDVRPNTMLAYVYPLPSPGIAVELFSADELEDVDPNRRKITNCEATFDGRPSTIGGTPIVPDGDTARRFSGIRLTDGHNGFARMYLNAKLEMQSLPHISRGAFDADLERFLVANRLTPLPASACVRDGKFEHIWIERRPIPKVTTVEDLQLDASEPQTNQHNFSGEHVHGDMKFEAPGMWLATPELLAAFTEYLDIAEGLNVTDLMALVAQGYYPFISNHRTEDGLFDTASN